MATEPTITVTEGTVTTNETRIGMASRIAVIGAFNSTITELVDVSNAKQAHVLFPDSTTTFKGNEAIDFLFIGASSLVVANITTWSTGENPTPETTLTNAKLEAALELLTHEEFDILFVAEELTDAAQTIVSAWLDSEFHDKFAHGQVAQLQKSTTSAYETSIATFNKNIYWIATQQYTYYGTLLSLNQSAALMCGLIAGMMVNRSLTAKVIPNISAVTPEYTTESASIGAKLLELNVPFIKCRNRNTKVHYCVNSLLPDELDLYINRVRDYIINRINVEAYLGEINNDASLEGIGNVIENIRYECVDVLGLLKDIEYRVEKGSGTCVNVILERLVFDNIITNINITYNIEVE